MPSFFMLYSHNRVHIISAATRHVFKPTRRIASALSRAPMDRFRIHQPETAARHSENLVWPVQEETGYKNTACPWSPQSAWLPPWSGRGNLAKSGNQ